MSADFVEDLAELTYFELQSGVHLQNREWLVQAFTHRSYLNEVEDNSSKDNERLEFLGDAVLSLVISQHLFDDFPDYSEGDLTRLRSMLVRRETLARVAERYMLGSYMRLGKGEEESGGRHRPATLCAVFESIIGATYQDQGLEAAKRLIFFLLKDEIQAASANALDKDAKSRLQEYVQSVFGVTPRYKTLSSVGPDHAKQFVIAVTISKLAAGVGQGHSKQEAAQAAAAEALFRFGQPAPEYAHDAWLVQTYPPAPLEKVLALIPVAE